MRLLNARNVPRCETQTVAPNAIAHARRAIEPECVLRVRNRGSVSLLNWTTHVMAAAALTGAAALLTGCKEDSHDHGRTPTTGAKGTPARTPDVSVVDSKGNTSILARGVIAAGVPTDPKGPRFFLLPANDASIVFDRVSRSSVHRVTTLGHVIGKEFTQEEAADIHSILEPLRPLWQCPNLEMRQFARVNMLINGRFLTPDVLGVAYSGPEGLIAIADTAHTRGGGFRAVVEHEVAHRLLQYADPRTCTNYNDAYENPLVQEFMRRVGWKDRNTLDPGMLRSESTASDYSHASPLEDMAESFAWYLGNRPELRRISKSRAEFWDWLFKSMHMAPPNSLHDPAAFPGQGNNAPEPTVEPPPAPPPPASQPRPTPPPPPAAGTPPPPPTTHEPPRGRKPDDKTVWTIGNPQDRVWRIEVRHGEKVTTISMDWNGRLILEQQ